jgi:hypothetical protein
MTESNLDNFPSKEELYEYFEKLEFTSDTGVYAFTILNLTSPLREDFLHWWRTGVLNSTVEVYGHTVKSLAEKNNWDIARAFSVLNSVYEGGDFKDAIIVNVSAEEWDKAVVKI